MLLRHLLYAPWALFIFLPYLAISTLFWGFAALTVAQFNQRWAFHCGTIWARLLCWANLTPVVVSGRHKVDPNTSYVIMCNHQSHFDVLAFYGHWYRQFRWVMKEELRKVPGLGPACAAVGHIYIDRSDREKAIASLNAARPMLKGGISVLFFPEGKRSVDGKALLPFKKGGFIIAQELGLPILPVTITGTSQRLPANTTKLTPGLVNIHIHDPIDVAKYSDQDRQQLMDIVRDTIASKL